jgi:hypothetical protein
MSGSSFLKSAGFILAIFFLSIVSGLRVGSGYDFYNYEYYYNTISSSPFRYDIEPLYYLICKISPTFYTSNFILSLLTNSLLFIACSKLHLSRIVFLLSFVFSEVYLSQFNIARQSLAFSFLALYACFLCNARGRVGVLVSSVMAISSHYMSILFLVPSVFLSRFKINILLMAVTLILVYLLSRLGAFISLFEFLVSFLPSKYSYYADENLREMSGGGGKFILEGIVFILCAYLLKNNKERITIFTINIVFLGLVISFIAIEIPILFRLAYLFLFFKVFLFSILLGGNGIQNKSNRIIVFIVFLTYIMSTFAMNISVNVYGVLPYSNYLF